jgi:hypothetical protein
MKKALPLLFLLLSSVFAVGQTTTQFTNAGSGPCVNPNYPRNYYCAAIKRYENGVWVGYLAFFFVLNADGETFQNGTYSVADTNDATIFSAQNFSGTFNGKTVNGTFSTSTVIGSTSQAMGLIKWCAGRYGCYYREADLGGSGTYTTK